MKILLVSPELSPYVRSNGTADRVNALARALRKLGHDARIILPCYKSIDDSGFSLRKGRKSIEVTIDGEPRKGLLRQSLMEGVPVYFIENRDYYQRDGLYGNGRGAYPDNAQRFGFFCHAVLQLLRRMDFRPDVLHLHGWQTGLIPVLLRTQLKGDPFFQQISTLFTLHDLSELGSFPVEVLESLGLSGTIQLDNGLSLNGQISFLKGALNFSDRINTLSHSYRDELLADNAAHPLAPTLRRRENALHGILNGIDSRQWDPSLDMNLCHPYNVDNLNGKKADKRALQKEMKLELEPLVPLVALIGTLNRDKGMDIVAETWDSLLQRDCQVILAGRGDASLETFFRKDAQRRPGKAHIQLDADAGMARRIFAGADLYLMPSRSEPCGLEQMIALRYGSVPVVHGTGALRDTVIDVDENPRQGNGFVFRELNPQALLGALDRALAAYHNRRQWLKLVKRGMMQDFNWNDTAEKYVELYRKTTEQRLP